MRGARLTLVLVASAALSLLGCSRQEKEQDAIPMTAVQMRMLIFALEDYNAAFGAPPSGDSRAIVRALYGDNPKDKAFLEKPTSGPGNVMLDPWQNPYDIEILSGNVARVRSAGRNGKLGDDDDLELVTELGRK